MGLGHKQITAIDKLFDACCRLQDDYQKLILGEASEEIVPALQHQLSELEKQISLVRASLADNAPTFFVDQCSHITDDIRSGINELVVTAQRQRLAESEQRYMSSLKKLFQFLEVPSDGNCLFAAIGRGDLINQQYRKVHALLNPFASISPSPPPPPAVVSAPSSRSASPARSAASDTTAGDKLAAPGQHPPASKRTVSPALLLSLITGSDVAKMTLIANQYRKRVIDYIKNNPDAVLTAVHDSHANDAADQAAGQHADTIGNTIQREVKDLLLQEKEGKHANATSTAVWMEMTKFYPDDPLEGVHDQQACIDTYCAVMSSEGIYGTIIEIEAMSNICQLPIAIYYKLDQRGSDSNPQPARIVGEQFLNPDSMIISLAYYMGNKHYNLLVPKQTIDTLHAYIKHQHEQQAASHNAHSAASSTSVASLPLPATEPSSTTPTASLPTADSISVLESPDAPTHHLSMQSPPATVPQPQEIVAAATSSQPGASSAVTLATHDPSQTPDLLTGDAAPAPAHATTAVAAPTFKSSPPVAVRAMSVFFPGASNNTAVNATSSVANSLNNGIATPDIVAAASESEVQPLHELHASSSQATLDDAPHADHDTPSSSSTSTSDSAAAL